MSLKEPTGGLPKAQKVLKEVIRGLERPFLLQIQHEAFASLRQRLPLHLLHQRPEALHEARLVGGHEVSGGKVLTGF